MHVALFSLGKKRRKKTGFALFSLGKKKTIPLKGDK
nr:MAG TPA: hypothetical protein [Caudoviricetes sp.]